MSATLAAAGVITPGSALTLEAVKALGLGTAAIRQARRKGLKVRRIGRKGFVLADELLAILKADDGQPKAEGG